MKEQQYSARRQNKVTEVWLPEKSSSSKKPLESQLGPGDNERLIAEYRETGDRTLLDCLVRVNRGLVYTIARPYLRLFGDRFREDIIQNGWVGFSVALNRFDNNKSKASFSSYAYLWIKALIQRFTDNSVSMVRSVSTEESREIRSHYAQAQRKIQNIHGPMCESELNQKISKELNVSESSIERVQASRRIDISLNARIKTDNGDGEEPINMIKIDAEDPECSYCDKEEIRMIRRLFYNVTCHMNQNSQTIAELVLLQGHTLQYAGDQVGVTRERARQIKNIVIAAMKNERKKVLCQQNY